MRGLPASTLRLMCGEGEAEGAGRDRDDQDMMHTCDTAAHECDHFLQQIYTKTKQARKRQKGRRPRDAGP